MKFMVLWHSLVVESYRAFFVRLADLLSAEVVMISPQQGSELGFQKVECQPSHEVVSASVNLYPVKTWRYHTQIILYRNLTKIFQAFAKPKHDKKIVFCAAEPFSLTALYIWFRAAFQLRSFSFILLGCQNFDKPYPLLLRLVRRFMYGRANAIAAIGPHQQDLLRKTGYKGPIFDFPLWFESKRFHYIDQTEAKTKLSQDYPFDMESILIGFIGPFNQQKGIMDLLQCVESYADKWPAKIQLFLVGKGELEEQVKRKAHRLRTLGIEVICPGHLPMDALPLFYASLDILVMPSRTQAEIIEQFGRVVIEGEACGCLAIGSDCGHIPYLLEGPKRVFKEGHLKSMFDVMSVAIKESVDGSTEARQQRAQKSFASYSDQRLAERFAETLRTLGD